VARQPIFKTKRDYQRAIVTLDYYQHRKPPLRLARALSLNKEEKGSYPWTESICQRNEILDFFPSQKGYRKFVYDQIDYAQKLEKIKHLVIENS